jgi:hypothetical protein
MVLSRGKQLAGAHERDDAPGRRGERDDRSGPGWILAIAENGKLRKKKGIPDSRSTIKGEKDRKRPNKKERGGRETGEGIERKGKITR